MFKFIPILAAIMLSACQTLNPVVEQQGNRPGLKARQLEPNACGLFVWTADQEKRFILFSQSITGKVTYDSAAGEVEMDIIKQSGQSRQGQFPVQIFGPDDWKLTLSRTEAIDNGTRYKAGTLALKDDKGWEIIIPVVGLSFCQPGQASFTR